MKELITTLMDVMVEKATVLFPLMKFKRYADTLVEAALGPAYRLSFLGDELSSKTRGAHGLICRFLREQSHEHVLPPLDINVVSPNWEEVADWFKAVEQIFHEEVLGAYRCTDEQSRNGTPNIRLKSWTDRVRPGTLTIVGSKTAGGKSYVAMDMVHDYLKEHPASHAHLALRDYAPIFFQRGMFERHPDTEKARKRIHYSQGIPDDDDVAGMPENVEALIRDPSQGDITTRMATPPLGGLLILDNVRTTEMEVDRWKKLAVKHEWAIVVLWQLPRQFHAQTENLGQLAFDTLGVQSHSADLVFLLSDNVGGLYEKVKSREPLALFFYPPVRILPAWVPED